MTWMKHCLRSLLAVVLMAAGLAHAVESDYVLGPGDILRIAVFQSPDLTVDTRISEGGGVTFPLLGTVKIGGLTVREAENKIAKGLREGNYMKQPQVSIILTEAKGSQVSVLGAVNRPSRYALEKTNTTLSQLLAQAGGPSASASDIVVLMGSRAGKPFRKEIDFPMIFAASNVAEDPILQNGDTIYVDTAPYVYVYGEVQSPGIKGLQRNMTLMQALAAAGGLNLRGTLKGLTVNRRDPQTGKITVVQPGMNDLLRKDDVVYVKESLF
jgi:polysaccharide biosynthesis/export protein